MYVYRIVTPSMFITEVIRKLKTETALKIYKRVVMVYKLLNVQSMKHLCIFKNNIEEYILWWKHTHNVF